MSLELRRYTMARVALGRAGNSLPTTSLLDFQLAHARARDAVHAPFDAHAVWPAALVAQSAAPDRATYLLRPDLGRKLSDESRQRIAALRGDYDLALIVSDGLSATAVQRHAAPVLERCLAQIRRPAPVIVVERGRVAIADEIGELLGARVSAILIGERPGLTAPDSMGIYITPSPRTGRTDADRKCISNIRPEGLQYEAAVERLIAICRPILSPPALPNSSSPESRTS